MSQRLRITLPDAVMAELKGVAARDGVPVSRVAAERVTQPVRSENTSPLPAVLDDDPVDDRHTPWIKPVTGDRDWHARMWGSIYSLHERYPHELGYLREGWWKDTVTVEMLCALVTWRSWIDVAGTDPREEISFQVQLADFSQQLRQQGGGVTTAWKPGAPPIGWSST